MQPIRFQSALLVGAQGICMGAFFYAVHRADMAMDKTGLGEPDVFARWNEIAGVWFSGSVILWIASIASFVWPAPAQTRGAAIYSVVAPALFGVGYPVGILL